MKNKMIIGRYLPYDSYIHRLDPRAKLLATIFYIVIIFFANNLITYFVMALIVLLGIHLSNIPMEQFIRGVKPMFWLFVFTSVLQIIFTPGITTYFEFGIISISKEGITNGVLVFMRFVLIIFMSILMTLTTEALRLTDAIEFFLTPFKKMGLPVADLALMLSIGMRFVPTLMDEAEKIMDAQRARGMDFNEGTVTEKIQNLVPLLVPLFNRSFDRAIELATAMEARDYQGGNHRSKYRELNWIIHDTIVLASFVVFFGIVLSLRR